jgi:hypothetical protein
MESDYKVKYQKYGVLLYFRCPKLLNVRWDGTGKSVPTEINVSVIVMIH